MSGSPILVWGCGVTGGMTVSSDWQAQLDAWLAPYLARLQRKEQRHWAALYLQGLIGPGERKSVEPMAERVAPGQGQQLHHFVAIAPWDEVPLEDELVKTADRLLGGAEAVLVIDDTALPKKGRHSVGVAHQYCGQLGKKANCQVLVSTTLARHEVPVGLGLRLYLPADWVEDQPRRARARVPEDIVFRPKWQIALDEIDRVTASGARFGCVLADADYGKVPEFRHGLSQRDRRFAVGIGPTQKVYPADVRLSAPRRKPGRGGQPKHPVPSVESQSIESLMAALPAAAWRTLSWRSGTKGALQAAFAARRVRVADGAAIARGQHLPGEEVWLVGEERAGGERKYHLANHPAETTLEELVAWIKGRWACEQMHQQLKEELGLGHFEGRSWRGLHHHALLGLLAFAFLQHLRLAQKKLAGPSGCGQCGSPPPDAARDPPPPRGRAERLRALLPTLQSARTLPSTPMNMTK